jgi:hypothetical protein
VAEDKPKKKELVMLLGWAGLFFLVVLNFTQELGGIDPLAISQNIFQQRLYANSAAAVPGFDPTLILKNGITDFRYYIPSRGDIVLL